MKYEASARKWPPSGLEQCLAFVLGDVFALQAPASFSLRTLMVTAAFLADNPRR